MPIRRHKRYVTEVQDSWIKGACCETIQEPSVRRGKRRLDDVAVRASSPNMLLETASENISDVSQERRPVSAKRQFPMINQSLGARDGL
jgi:hypothetical protein